MAVTVLTGGLAQLLANFDRPIGLQPSGQFPTLPRRAIVLTREMIESAIAASGGSFARLTIQLVDAPDPQLLGAYELYLQVERIP